MQRIPDDDCPSSQGIRSDISSAVSQLFLQEVEYYASVPPLFNKTNDKSCGDEPQSNQLLMPVGYQFLRPVLKEEVSSKARQKNYPSLWEIKLKGFMPEGVVYVVVLK
jgi:hypothetical protein